MKHHIPKSNDGLHLDNPVLIESKTSFIVQFIYYFLFLCLGVTGMYGCFYTAFSIPLSQQVVILYAIVFCAIFTILFLSKPKRMLLLLLLSVAAAVLAIFLKRSLLDVLFNNLTQGFSLPTILSFQHTLKKYSIAFLPFLPLLLEQMKY